MKEVKREMLNEEVVHVGKDEDKDMKKNEDVIMEKR